MEKARDKFIELGFEEEVGEYSHSIHYEYTKRIDSAKKGEIFFIKINFCKGVLNKPNNLDYNSFNIYTMSRPYFEDDDCLLCDDYIIAKQLLVDDTIENKEELFYAILQKCEELKISKVQKGFYECKNNEKEKEKKKENLFKKLDEIEYLKNDIKRELEKF